MAEEENKPKRYRRTNVDIQADIIKAAESLIKKKGFASMLVTELIKKARIEPLVFYNRYDNLSEFYDEFVKRYDYWFKDVLTGVQFPTDSELGYISIFKDVQKALQDKSVMLELLRWEIAEGNETTVRTAMLREMHTLPLVNIYEEKFKDTGIDISAISSLIIGGIYYLNLHRERSKFSDIDLNTEQGQKRIDRAIENLGHMIFHYQELNDYKRTVSEKLKEKGISDVIIKECLVKWIPFNNISQLSFGSWDFLFYHLKFPTLINNRKITVCRIFFVN